MPLTNQKLLKRRNAEQLSVPLVTGTIHGGAMVAMTASNVAIAAGAVGALAAIGFAERTVQGPGQVPVWCGCAQLKNSADADEIERQHIGDIAYVVDDETVALTDDDGARQIAGTIFDVDEVGVWVIVRPGAVGPEGPEGPAGGG